MLNAPIKPEIAEHPALLRALHSGPEACLRQFLPLVLHVAKEFELSDVDDAVLRVTHDLCALRDAQVRSGLSVHAWVIGVTRRRFRLLTAKPS